MKATFCKNTPTMHMYYCQDINNIKDLVNYLLTPRTVNKKIDDITVTLSKKDGYIVLSFKEENIL